MLLNEMFFDTSKEIYLIGIVLSKHFLKTFFIVLTANSAQSLDSERNGASVICLMPRFFQYVLNLKSIVKHFAPTDVIVFGMSNRAIVFENI